MMKFIFLKVFAVFVIYAFTPFAYAQKNGESTHPKTPKIVQVDETTVRPLLKPDGKLLLINFWATWCIPCREEFPDLVEIDKEFKGKIEFITITLDDPVEIDRDVPKFLNEMKATMPTYLLYTNDENGVIGSISKDWQGGLPFSVLYDKDGSVVLTKQGKINPELVKSKLNSLLAENEIITVTELVKILNSRKEEAVYYYKNNWKAFRETALQKGYIHSYELIVSDQTESSGFDIILITRYRGKLAFEKSEERFRGIIDTAPGGLKLKNKLKPSDFRKGVSVTIGKTIAFPRSIDPKVGSLPKSSPLRPIH